MKPVPRESEILVAMGQLAVAKSEGSLRTLLGSCIGILLYDPELKVAGLGHIVMPDSLGRQDCLGKYADTAVPELVRMMTRLTGRRPLRLKAKVAGGSNMFPTTASSAVGRIGESNLAAVQLALTKANIAITAQHCGGTRGRRMFVDVATAVVHIEMLGSPPLII